jgi:sigma-E factor negative regulatory protein RseA
MAQETMNDQEVISALADGQLRGEAFIRAMKLLESTDHRATWHAHHVVGDVLRMGELPTVQRDRAFLQRLQSTLAHEAVPNHSQARPILDSAVSRSALPVQHAPAVNDAQFRWKAWGGLASICVVSIVSWQMYVGVDKQAKFAQVPASSETAQATAPAAVVAVAGSASPGGADNVMIRDPRLDALLTAHQQSGGASAFQNPTGFVRSATFTEVGR